MLNCAETREDELGETERSSTPKHCGEIIQEQVFNARYNEVIQKL